MTTGDQCQGAMTAVDEAETVAGKTEKETTTMETETTIMETETIVIEEILEGEAHPLRETNLTGKNIFDKQIEKGNTNSVSNTDYIKN